MTDTYTIRDLCRDVAEEVRERSGELRDERFEDTIAEIADSNTPIYTSDILAYAKDDNSLATDVPEIGPAFDGEPTPVNIIAANIYERLSNAAYEALRELQEEWEDEEIEALLSEDTEVST